MQRALHRLLRGVGRGQGVGDELTRDQALDVTRQVAQSGIRCVAFGGGEPLSVAHCWEIFDALSMRFGRAAAAWSDIAATDRALVSRIVMYCTMHELARVIGGDTPN